LSVATSSGGVAAVTRQPAAGMSCGCGSPIGCSATCERPSEARSIPLITGNPLAADAASV
jgi:hypothetical protein